MKNIVGKNKKRILMLVNHGICIYKMRLELVSKLLKEGYEVHISLPGGEQAAAQLKELGCCCHNIDMNRHGMNPAEEIGLLWKYKRLVTETDPAAVLTYTVKPNIYGGLVCAHLKIPYIANVTGLGTAVEHEGPVQKMILALYKEALKRAQKVFFQNRQNMSFMTEKGIIRCPYALLPGSGVNLDEFPYMEYPKTEEPVIFLVIGRLMKDKGTDEILDAARIIRKRYKQVIFRFIGSYEEKIYREKIRRAVKEGIAEYAGSQQDVRPFIRESHATIHASYHEGMSNVLLETAACGRPVLATDVPGCIETFTPGVSGIAFKARDTKSLVRAVEAFLSMSLMKKRMMGKRGRQKVEAEFDRGIIVNAYMEEIQQAAEAAQKNKRR